MSDDFDLDAYFGRIGYSGDARPDLATLAALHVRQVAAIPFESLDPLLGRPVKLDIASLQAKLVGCRRGGYCFEQNALFKAALEAIGFAVTGLAGRVVWMSPPGAPLGARSHMLLKVDLPEGPYLADAGFGAHLLDAPLKLEPDLDQMTPSAVYRLVREGERFALTARVGDDWRRTYVFDLEPQSPADYAVANWFTSTHPDGLFTNNLLAERLTGEARFNLFNTRLTERRRDGEVIETTLATAEALGEALERVFGLEPPAPAKAVFARVSG
jgi:N-hydroxyarylamine O-acetyltransferase